MFKILRIHHAAVVVENIDTSLPFWRDALKLDLSHIEDMKEQEALVAFLPLENSEIELVQPTTKDSGIAKFLEKRGEGIHHLCMQVDDLEACLDHLRNNQIRLINDQPMQGAGGSQIAFIHPESASGVLIELYELAE